MRNRNIVHHRKQEYRTSMQTGILYNPENRNFVQHRKQEYCTSMKTGILYNPENRNFVQHRKQEYCTSLLCAHYMCVFPQFNSPQDSHTLFFIMLSWIPNACSEVSEYEISNTPMMTLNF